GFPIDGAGFTFIYFRGSDRMGSLRPDPSYCNRLCLLRSFSLDRFRRTHLSYSNLPDRIMAVRQMVCCLSAVHNPCRSDSRCHCRLMVYDLPSMFCLQLVELYSRIASLPASSRSSPAPTS